MAKKRKPKKELPKSRSIKEMPLKEGRDSNYTLPGIVNNFENIASAKVKAIKDKCAYLYRNGHPFTLKKSGTSYSLSSDLFNSKAFRGGFSPEDLAFIKKVKKYINDHDVADKFIDKDYLAEPIHYIEVKKYNEGDILDNIVEIDINAAYWQTAYILGIISQGIFNYGMKTDKRVRLAALGSLAKRTTTWEFDGKDFKKKPEKRSYETENIWFAICRRVSDVMKECLQIAGEDFVFYWVDGIYIKSSSDKIGKIMHCLAKWGYEGKIKYIQEISFIKNRFYVQGMIKDDKREFVYNADEKVKSIREWNEDYKLRKLAEEIFFNKKDFLTIDAKEVDVY